LNEYAVLASTNGIWSFHNIIQGVNLTQIKNDSDINSAEFHPDGIILATGQKDGIVKLWDIRTQKSDTKNSISFL